MDYRDYAGSTYSYFISLSACIAARRSAWILSCISISVVLVIISDTISDGIILFSSAENFWYKEMVPIQRKPWITEINKYSIQFQTFFNTGVPLTYVNN